MLTPGAGFVLAAGGATAVAQTVVDQELSLVVDVSGSVSSSEYALQVGGYADAFRDMAVQDAIDQLTDGLAVNAVFFATSATEGIPFTLLQDANDADGFATTIENFPRPTNVGGSTDPASGINLAAQILLNNAFDGPSVIDVSGDGVDNVFPTDDTDDARDDALAAGVDTVNGLVVGNGTVLDFYQNNVIGGTDAFVLTATDFDEFDDAVTTKLQIETGGTRPPPPVSPS